MIGADSNVLVRHLTHDDPEQTERVRALFDDAERLRMTVFVSHVVLCELCWVLSAVYEFGKSEIAEGIDSLLADALFTIQERAAVESALAGLKRQGGQFADHLIGVIGIGAGATSTYTFDRQAARLPGFELLR